MRNTRCATSTVVSLTVTPFRRSRLGVSHVEERARIIARESPVQSQTPREPQPHGDVEVWAEIRRGWRERDYRTLHKVVEGLPGVPVGEIDGMLDGEVVPDRESAEAVVERAFVSAESPENRVLVALYVYACCLGKWERSTDYARIRHVLRALESTVERVADNGRTRELLGILVTQAKAMEDAMAVESGVNCSCPVETGKRASRVVNRMKDILQRLDSDDELAEVARQDAETQRLYFEAVSRAAAAVEGLVDPSRARRITVDTAIRRIESAENDELLSEDVYRSELRAHRLTLAELRKAEELPRLHVEQADLVYVYPFALDGFESAKVDDLIGEKLSLAGFGEEPIEVHALELTDLWELPERAESELGYGGASITLPEVWVTTTARANSKLDPENKLKFDVEVRLSRLGNHYLRVSSMLEDADLHEVNQALRRGSRSMGEETFGTRQMRFAEYAKEAAEAVADAIGGEPVGDPNATFHVALSASAISVRQPGDDPQPATLKDLTGAVGSALLFQPVSGLATALEEWIRYPQPAVGNLLRPAGYEGELVARTTNTTVLYMPDSPDWRTAGYQEMIEFVASMPPLLMLWERQAITHAEKLEETLRRLRRGTTGIEPDRLYLLEAELRERESEIRQDLGFIHSPALCRDRSQREFIDALWEAAGLPLLETDLNRRLSHLSALQERVSAIASAVAEQHRQREQQRAAEVESRQQERARRIEVYFQLAGLILAVASLAEVASLINGGFDRPHWVLISAEVALLLVIAVGVLVLILRQVQSHR
jgi:hypothetical protein